MSNVPLYLHLPRRARLPLEANKLISLRAAAQDDLPDPANVQGDIYLGFPKTHQAFIFFIITDHKAFIEALQSYQPSSSKDVTDLLQQIANAKASGTTSTIKTFLTEIAFSLHGLQFLRIGQTGDPRFDTRSMRDDKKYLGDGGDWDSTFDGASIHGVLTVCAKGQDLCDDGVKSVKDIFDSSCNFVSTMPGNVRPGIYKDHEHFGYMDGLSQPSLRGLMDKNPGQREVDPGVIILGYKGDPVFDDPSAPQRADWTRDGSFMVFRKLEQDVIGFNKYLSDNKTKWRNFTPVPDEVSPPLNTTDNNTPWGTTEAEEFIGATLVGRWKSGTPIALAHFRDDESIQADPQKTNNFDYSVTGVNVPSNQYCPFNAHTRKTTPRNLDPYIQRKFLESSMIVRTGIPYGKELNSSDSEDSDSEDTASDDTNSDDKRGLLFVSYQASLDNGFVRQSVEFAANNFFPATAIIPQNNGQDPIIGGPPPGTGVNEPIEIDETTTKPDGQIVLSVVKKDSSDKYEITGFAQKVNTSVDGPTTYDYFVTSRGGEYFFVPSISTLTLWSQQATGVDLLFLMDATGSMQPFIDQARSAVDKIYDSVLQDGNWSKSDVRVGIVAFRDHAQKDDQGVQHDYGFVTKTYDFTTDMGTVTSNLNDFDEEGGGDVPEAHCDALAEALGADWDDDHIKVVVCITDSSPHHTGEHRDKFPDGCPEQNDPLEITDLMADRGIVLYVVGCERKMSALTSNAIDFWTGVTKKTGGKLLPLSNVDELPDFITNMNTDIVANENLLNTYKSEVLKRKGDSIDTIASSLYSKMKGSGVKVATFTVDPYFVTMDDNVKVWFESKSLNNLTSTIQKYKGTSRVAKDYRGQNAKTPKATLETSAVSLEQATTLVRKCLLRGD